MERQTPHPQPIQFNSPSHASLAAPKVISNPRPVLQPIDPSRNRPAPIALRPHHESLITDRPRLPPACEEDALLSDTTGEFPAAEHSTESSSINSLTPYLLGNNDDDQYSDEAGENDDTQDDEEEISESSRLLLQEKQMKSRSHLIRDHWNAGVLSNLRYRGSVSGLEVKLLQHQRKGVRWMLGREVPPNEHPGGLLCDDMGLGKTVQSISLILLNPMPEKDSYTRSDERPVLVKTTVVVVPKSLLTQWVNEINDMAPDLSVLAFDGSTKVRNNFPSYDVVVTTYPTVLSHSGRVGGSAFAGYRYWRLILDEAHTIKNVKTKTFQAVCAISAWSRWCLTGTPLHNSINDIQALLNFIKVPPYNDYAVWKKKIGLPLSKGSESAMTKLQLVLSCVMYRRTKEALKKALKARRVHRVEVSFLPHERAFYDRMKASVMSHFGENGKLSGTHMLVMLLRLRQLCNHQSLVATHNEVDYLGEMTDPPQEEDLESVSTQLANLGVEADEETPNPPLDYQKVFVNGTPVFAGAKIAKILEYLTTEPRKTIIFSQFVKFFDVLGPFLERKRIRYVTYTGGMPSGLRDASLNVLRNSPEPIVLLCSLKCGSLGLNLTSANRVILVDPWWNPMISQQAIDRVHRIGQTVDVDVYELYVAGTVEKKILELQEKKSRVANSVMTYDKQMMERLQQCTRDELLSLLIH